MNNMETKIALLVIYNHRFDKNIPVLEELFKGKFTYVYHIVPFYDGDRENVLPVYESSYYFSGYIAQALNQIKDKSFTHYVFTSDDLMLNPILNENNILEEIGIDKDDSYMPRFRTLDDVEWSRSLDAMTYKLYGLGAEVEKVLPTKEDAEMILRDKGYSFFDELSYINAFKAFHKHYRNTYSGYLPSGFLFSSLKKLIKSPFSVYRFNYPLIGGYNDFFIVPAFCIKKFSLYCGAFAASKLFVEVALPTAMALSSKRIRTSSDTKMRCGDLWLDDIRELENKYNYSLSDLMSDFPKDTLYRHPVKLSKWK